MGKNRWDPGHKRWIWLLIESGALLPLLKEGGTMYEFTDREVDGFGDGKNKAILSFFVFFFSLYFQDKSNPMAREPPNNLHCKMTTVTHSITRKVLLIPSDHKNQYPGCKN